MFRDEGSFLITDAVFLVGLFPPAMFDTLRGCR